MRTQELASLNYITETFVKELPIMKEIRQELESDQLLSMSVSPLEGALLNFLVQSHFQSQPQVQDTKAVEIGTLYGYSALWLAQALPEGGRLWTVEIDPERSQKARDFAQRAGLGERIEFVAGPAMEKLSEIEDQGPFDLVFIDADKAAYMDYLRWADRNLQPGGLIVGDNTFLFGAVYGHPTRSNFSSGKAVEVMKEFNSWLATSPHYQAIMLPTLEGMTVARKL